MIWILSSRWTDGPRVNNVEPIMVVFEDKDEKDQLWSKLSMKIVDDIVKRRGSIAITNVGFLSVATLNYYWMRLWNWNAIFQDSSSRRRSIIEANCHRFHGAEMATKKTAVVKPMTTSKVKTVKKDQKQEKDLPVSPTRNYNKKHGIKCNFITLNHYWSALRFSKDQC